MENYTNSKRGQITYFILIGLVILLVSIFFLFIQDIQTKSLEENAALQTSLTAPIKNYIESCIKLIGEDAVLWVSEHGGYFEMPPITTKDRSIDIPYYFHVNANLMPSKEKLEEELSKYVDSNLFYCLNNLNDFENFNAKAIQEDISTKTLVLPDNVLFNVYVPVVIKTKSGEVKITSFSSSIKNIKLYTMFDIIQKIMNRQMSEPNFIHLSFISNFMDENNLSIDLKVLNNDTIVFTIFDNENWIKKSPLQYMFANKYKRNACIDLPSEEDDFSTKFILDCINNELRQIGYSLKIADIPDLNATINKPFYYDINASGVDLIFTDYSELFDITNLTGEINFTPDKEDIGEYLITIKIKDKINNSDFGIFRLNISEDKI